MDNFYNSHCLAKTLKTTQGRLCRFTKTGRGEIVPKNLKDTKLEVFINKKNKKKIKNIIIIKKEHSILAMFLSQSGVSKKTVTMILMYHSHDTGTVKIRGKEIVKPISVLDYNQCMGGVDLKDQLLYS
jgi:hypothetical protein